MSTCRRTALIGSFVFGLGLALHCGPSQDCLRFSDCADGLTCASGRCVPPPGPASTGDSGTKPADSGVAEAASVDAPVDTGEDRGALEAASPSDSGGAKDGGDACVGCADGATDSPSDATAD